MIIANREINPKNGLTEDEIKITRLNEAKEIPDFPNYLITPAGWVWSYRRSKFLKRIGIKNRTSKRFGYVLCNNYGQFYFHVRDLVEGIFNIEF